MPSVFNIVRASIYAAVVVWTIICLAIAVHFQSILVSSELTHFIPFAIFVCSASLLLVLALLGFGLWRDRNPISTRIELGCLGLAGVLWLALGAFLASSESEAADVECFSSSNASEPFEMPGFNTETYHAQYRVLEAFSFFNIILIWAFLLMLLGLAIRHHRWGDRTVWLTSVTAFPWFSRPGAQTGKQLPAPVTARRSKSTKSQKPKAIAAPATPEKEERPAMAPRRLPSSGRHSPTRNEVPTYVYWMPHKEPEPVHVRSHSYSRTPRDKYGRDASPRR
ncbi:hypothetical protein K474DRAFT_1587065 [Panus rudis PR-1116 ss-1]|nr:hypothetical protein K474DRAFT_1587065 [Panus rudis PR-1116 ss-1]